MARSLHAKIWNLFLILVKYCEMTSGAEGRWLTNDTGAQLSSRPRNPELAAGFKQGATGTALGSWAPASAGATEKGLGIICLDRDDLW